MNIGRIPSKAAQIDPTREALIDVPNDRRMTFGELDKRVCRLGNTLKTTLRLDKGARVGVLSRNCIQYMEIMFASARTGLITLPLNWRLSEPELMSVLEDGEPDVVFFSQEYLSVAQNLAPRSQHIRWIGFDDLGRSEYEQLVASCSDDEPLASADVVGSDPALILYTGGTTGKSKGALHTHHSLFMGMMNQTVAERIVPSDVYMLTGQMFHIPVALAMNYTAHGCPVVLINFDAKLALEVIQRERVSAFLGITTMINWMMAVENFESYDLSSLRNFQYGGGPMPRSVVEAALKAFPCTMIQGYGQTEGMTMTFLSQDDHDEAISGGNPERLASCGRSGFVTEVRLVDADGHDVARDCATHGEIVVRSEANMIGYWRRPELTAETLKDGWLWTGDIAVWDEKGYIYIVDRAKDMIISGGENIFSTQVEAAIHRHPDVLESAVFGVPDDVWGEAVKAVVVLKPGCSATAAEIIAEASKHLASYQKPKSVDFVDALPKAPTGKILKRELREPYWQNSGRKV